MDGGNSGRQVGYFTDEVQVRISRMVCFAEITVVDDFVDVVALSLLIRSVFMQLSEVEHLGKDQVL